jgi:hypothetical protein
MANLKSITNLPLADSAEGLNVIVNDNGSAKQIPASSIGGGVFIIDSTASNYSTSNTSYGNTIKEALLNGKTVYYYDGSYYFSVVAFNINETTTGDVYLVAYVSGYSGTYGPSFEPRPCSFAITL